MSDFKKVILWFAVVLVLAVYAKMAGLVPVKIDNSGQVLGQQTGVHFPK